MHVCAFVLTLEYALVWCCNRLLPAKCHPDSQTNMCFVWFRLRTPWCVTANAFFPLRVAQTPKQTCVLHLIPFENALMCGRKRLLPAMCRPDSQQNICVSFVSVWECLDVTCRPDSQQNMCFICFRLRTPWCVAANAFFPLRVAQTLNKNYVFHLFPLENTLMCGCRRLLPAKCRRESQKNIRVSFASVWERLMCGCRHIFPTHLCPNPPMLGWGVLDMYMDALMYLDTFKCMRGAPKHALSNHCRNAHTNQDTFSESDPPRQQSAYTYPQSQKCI